MADPIPLTAASLPPRYRRLHAALAAVLGASVAGAVVLRWRWAPAVNPKIGLIVPAGIVVAATFLFTAALVFGPYRRGLLYKIAKGTWPPGGDALGEGARLARAYGARLAVPWGLVVASGVFDAVCYAVQGRWPNLAVALGCVVALGALTPTRGGCARFVQRGQAALPELRAGP